MNQIVKTELNNFFSKVKDFKSEGLIIPEKELQKLNSKIGNLLPSWYIELLVDYPLAGVEIEYDLVNDNFSFVFAKPQDIFNETEKLYPGIAIKDLGYFCIGLDCTGSGDPIFSTNRKGDNPPIFIVYHDVSDIGEEIERDGMVKIADSFSDFFAKAKIRS
jgi:hypothetical protein